MKRKPTFYCKVPDYPKVKSDDIIPTECVVEKHELQEIVTIQDDPEYNLVVYDIRSKLKIQVEERIPQYFHLRAWRNISYFDVFNGDTIFFQNYKEDLTPSFRTRVEHITILHEPGILFDSKVFETKPDGITLNFQIWFSTIGEVRSPLYLEIRNVSEDYYRFHKSVGEQEFSAGRNSLLYDRNVLIHNNIEGGIGNFGGYNVTLDSLRW